MVRVQDSARRSDAPLCSVCDGRRAQAPIILCVDCAHPDRVRTYCASCEMRLDLSLVEAQGLFHKFGLTITHPGVTLFFPDGCLDCRGLQCNAPEIYILDDPELHHGRVA
ncbi:hypothetical protein HY630_00975 [Candidatus Uhrbacteria bacterium]|nr:hypothetical protein [Candidatus Uhrbacteria bacterium]